MILTSVMSSTGKSRILSIVAAIMVAVYLFAGWLTLDVQLHHDSMAALGCQSISKSETCMVDSGAHISWWERVFTSTGASQEGVQLLFAIGLLAFLGCFLLADKAVPTNLLRHCATSKDPPELRFHNYLLTYYSQGTAQPILYA